MYEVYLERAAERDLRRLSEETFHRIVPRICALAENPRPPGCRKLTGSENDWRIRIGDYRVVYEIDEAEKDRESVPNQTPPGSIPVDP